MHNTITLHGKVELGEDVVVHNSVILGSSEEGKLEIGQNSIIRSGTTIYSAVRIGCGFKSGHNVLIRENVQIGDNVLVGTNSVVDGNCRIGNNVSIQTGAYITKNTVIEDDSFLGPFCVTANDKHMEYGAELRGPIIRRGARIGANATILPGIVIGRGAIVGAGSVVTHDVKDGDVVVGNPARSMRGDTS